jgi:nitrogen regulatory protein P-II 2
MELTSIKLVVVIAEQVLQQRIITELNELNISGYTCSSVSGEGSRGLRASTIPGDNVRFEVLAQEDTAMRLLDVFQREYFPSYAIICYVSTVEVVRGVKFR